MFKEKNILIAGFNYFPFSCLPEHIQHGGGIYYAKVFLRRVGFLFTKDWRNKTARQGVMGPGGGGLGEFYL